MISEIDDQSMRENSLLNPWLLLADYQRLLIRCLQVGLTFSMISPWNQLPCEQRFLSCPRRVWDQLPYDIPFFYRYKIDETLKWSYSIYHPLANTNRYQLTNTHRLTWIDRMVTDNRFSSIDYASKTETGAEKRERIWKSFLTD